MVKTKIILTNGKVLESTDDIKHIDSIVDISGFVTLNIEKDFNPFSAGGIKIVPSRVNTNFILYYYEVPN